MDLETLLRAYLDPKNTAGRSLAEYRLRVEQLQDGDVIAVVVHPEGFPGNAVTFGVAGNTLLASSELEASVSAVRQARENGVKALDLAQQARDELARAEIGKAEIAKQVAEKEAAAKARPPDPSAGTVEP